MSDNPSNLTAVTAKVFDNGASPIKIMQPAHQATNIVTLTATNVTSTTLVATTINSIITALINAGIVKP